MSDKYDQLEKLKRLRDNDVLTIEEYEAEKALILSANVEVGGKQFWGMEERVYCMLLHLSQLLGVVLPFIPFIGIIVPIVMWVSEKDKSRAVDAHGRIVLNWAISYIIYFAVSLILIVVLIGGFLLAGVIVLNIVFAIIGGVKANNGELWPYPLSIPFFKVPKLEDSATSGSQSSAERTSTFQSESVSANSSASTTPMAETAPKTESNAARATDDPMAAESSDMNSLETKRPSSGTASEPRNKEAPKKDESPGSDEPKKDGES